VEEGERRISSESDYNSHNTIQLDEPGMKQLLLKLDLVQRIARGETIVMDD
jgi:UDP-glucose 4-epimerase